MQTFFTGTLSIPARYRLCHPVRATVAVGLPLYSSYIDYNHFYDTLINFVNSIAFKFLSVMLVLPIL